MHCRILPLALRILLIPWYSIQTTSQKLNPRGIILPYSVHRSLSAPAPRGRPHAPQHFHNAPDSRSRQTPARGASMTLHTAW